MLLANMRAAQDFVTLLHYDNRSAIQIAHNYVFHERTKHIENYCHFIPHHLQGSTLNLQSIFTIEQPADIFIKALSPIHFHKLHDKLKLISTLPP